MLTDTILFYIFAAMVLSGGILTITRRNAIHSAISLIVSLLGVAGLYLLQQAEFLFAIMLVNLDLAAKERQFNRQWLVALAAVAVVGAEVSYFIYRGAGSIHIADVPVPGMPAGLGNTEMVADSLFGEYLLPFEIASILLLVAVVGSVVMAKKRI